MRHSIKGGGAKSLKITERYLLSLAVAFSATTVAVSLDAAATLDLYVSLYVMEYFILTLLHSPFRGGTQRVTNLLGYALFAVFVLIVAFKVIQILGGSLI